MPGKCARQEVLSSSTKGVAFPWPDILHAQHSTLYIHGVLRNGQDACSMLWHEHPLQPCKVGFQLLVLLQGRKGLGSWWVSSWRAMCYKGLPTELIIIASDSIQRSSIGKGLSARQMYTLYMCAPVYVLWVVLHGHGGEVAIVLWGRNSVYPRG